MTAYVRNTRDEYDVEGDYGYGYGFVLVTCEETRAAARERLREYRENEPGVPFRIVKRRVRLEVAT